MLLGGGLLLALLRHALLRGVDDDALRRASIVATALRKNGVSAAALGPPAARADLVQVLRNGQVVLSSPALAGAGPMTHRRPTPGTVIRQEHARLPEAAAGEYRLLARGVRGLDGQELVVAVAQSTEPVEDTLAELSALLAVASPVLVLLAGASAFLLVGRALAPVEVIRRQVAEIDAGALDHRVPVPAARDEIARLATTMNSMLARLESAATAQRRFVSDSSHELRSPLASVRTTVEVARQHPALADWGLVADTVLAEVDRLQMLVTDLLLLAGSDEGGLQLRRAHVDLDDIVSEEVTRLRRETDLVVRAMVEPVRVVGDRARLARAVRNLNDNAARHARQVVELRLAARDGQAVLEIGDDGPGIPGHERERVFERFVRLDAGRSRDLGGAGLGLPIVRQIIRAHGGRVQHLDAPDGGALVVVWLPMHDFSDRRTRTETAR